MSPNNPKKLSKLYSAMDYSRRKLEPFRRNHFNMVRQYVGSNYSDNGSDDKMPVNLMELAVNIYTQQLVANSPKVLVTTRQRQLKPYAVTLELACNHLLKEIQFHKVLRRAVIDALFSIGIVKSGIELLADQEVYGYLRDLGQPFAENVSLNDWVHDTEAEVIEKCEFMGDRYRLPYEWVMESGVYDKQALSTLKPTLKSYYDSNEYDPLQISKGSDTDPDEYQSHVELWDIWLPQENLVLTLPAEGEGRPLRVIEWDGPETGQYDLLCFNDVPGNIMPLPPASLWSDLNDISNRLFRKLGRQAERQKTILGIQSGADEDGNRIVDANDGEAIRMDNPDKAREYNFGGIDQTSLAFLLQLKDMFVYLGGNLDTLGGLSPMSETVGQDTLLNQNASKRVAEMQDRVVDFAGSIIEKEAWYLWYDPLIQLPLVKQRPGSSFEIPTVFDPEKMEGDFLDYNFDIEPYSMQHSSPGMKLQTLLQTFQQYVLPLLPVLQQQGINVNIQALFETISKYANVPELMDVLEVVGVSTTFNPGVVGEMSPKPAVTKHTTERVNRPGSTRSGKDQALSQALINGSANQDQLASIGRPTG